MANQLFNSPIQSGYVANGPIAGVMADQQYNDWQGAQQRAFRDSDLENQIRQNEYGNALEDNPVKASKRALDTATNQADLGLVQQKAETKLAEEITKMSSAQLQDSDNKAHTALSLVSEMPDPSTNTPVSQAQWSGIVDRAKKIGLELPSIWSPEAAKVLQSRGQGADMYLKQRQQSELQKARLESEEYRTKMASDATIEASKNRSLFGSTSTLQKMDEVKKIILEISTKPTWTEDDYIRMKSAMAIEYISKMGMEPKKLAVVEEAKIINMKPKELAAKAAEVGLPPTADTADIANARVNKMVEDEVDKKMNALYKGKPVQKNDGNIVKIGGGESPKPSAPTATTKPEVPKQTTSPVNPDPKKYKLGKGPDGQDMWVIIGGPNDKSKSPTFQ